MYDHYDALIFDMDGTLIDSGELHEHAWTHALDHYGIPVDRKLMSSLAGVATVKIIHTVIEHLKLPQTLPIHEIATTKEQWVEENKADYVKATPLLEVVQQYAGTKPMAVGTGATRHEALGLLDACNLTTYFDTIVGACDVNNYKPAPDTFLVCAERLGAKPENCIVFEDSPMGIQAAKSAGMAWVNVQTELNIVSKFF